MPIEKLNGKELDAIQESIVNLPIVINFTEQGEDYFIMLELKSVPAKGNRDYNICRPLDIQKDGRVFFSTDPFKLRKSYKILTEEECRVVFPRGDLSGNRDIIFYLPFNFDVTDPKLKNTKLFRFTKPFTEKITSLIQVNNSMRERILEIEDIVRDVVSLELPTEVLEKALNIIKIIKEQQEEQVLPKFELVGKK